MRRIAARELLLLARMRPSLASLFLLLPLAAACSSAPKQPVVEDFSDLAALDSKSDAFSYRMKIFGSLDYGQTSATIKSSSTPRFRAYKFGGHAGDRVDAWVRSPNGGDAVAWLLDDSFKVLAHNDDADDTTLDAHLSVTLTPNHDPAIITYYVVYRDYALATAKFSVQLDGVVATPDFYSCKADSDCVAVPRHVCCAQCMKEAVNKDMAEAYSSQPQVCRILCTALCRIDERVAECNRDTGKCEMVEIADIKCGGHTPTPHLCPPDTECQGPALASDGFGSCLAPAAPAFCGGFANIACPVGLTCVDDPNDSCDPQHGGADCGGICQ